MKFDFRSLVSRIAPPSPFGCALGGLAFLASLTPSLIPRPALMQGVIAAFAFMLAYGIGTGILAIYRWLGFTRFSASTRQVTDRVLIAVALILIVLGLAFAADWQNATNRPD